MNGEVFEYDEKLYQKINKFIAFSYDPESNNKIYKIFTGNEKINLIMHYN